ncbi:aspartate/glutamate racemase family protein, partial [Candidatus Woesearchaeota archaeon]|nr:aspartate/glutamate racemase family protein [Candidatus Woesearchaeota archaeon]
KNEELVMQAIYGIKGGLKDEGRKILQQVAKDLVKAGAEIIIAGCTEIPLVLQQKNLNFILLDPSKIVAESAIALASRDNIIGQESIQKTSILEKAYN